MFFVCSKDGRLLFLEHVVQPEGCWAYTLQRVLDPLWHLIACGCRLTRNTGDLLMKSGFADLTMNEVQLDIPGIVSRHVYGCAKVD